LAPDLSEAGHEPEHFARRFSCAEHRHGPVILFLVDKKHIRDVEKLFHVGLSFF
jgi:hypothetical protein